MPTTTTSPVDSFFGLVCSQFDADGSEDFEEWMQAFDLCCAARGWTSTDKCRRLPAHLKGYALDVFRDLDENRKGTYAVLVQALTEKLSSPDAVKLFNLEWSRISQKEGEAVTSYCSRLRRVFRGAFKQTHLDDDVRDELLLSKLLATVRPEFQKILIIKEPDSVEEAIRVCRAKEASSKILLGEVDVPKLPTGPGVKPKGKEDKKAPAESEETRLTEEGLVRCLKAVLDTKDKKEPEKSAAVGFADGNRGAVCQLCERVGHTVKNCGYSGGGRNGRQSGGRGGQTQGQGSSLGRGRGRQGSQLCHYCRRPGHFIRECRTRVEEQGFWRGQTQAQRPTPQPPRFNSVPPQLLPPQQYNRQAGGYYVTEGEEGDQGQGHQGSWHQSQGPQEQGQQGQRNRTSFGPAPDPWYPWMSVCLGIMVILSMAGGISGSTAVGGPLLCQVQGNDASTLWRLPQGPECRLQSSVDAETATPASLLLYKVNHNEYKSEAYTCFRVQETLGYLIYFFGDELKTKKGLERIATSEQQCRAMVDFHECDGKPMVKVGSMWETQDKITLEEPSAPIHCCTWHTQTVTRCYMYETKVFKQRDREGIEGAGKDLSHCQYEEETCTLQDLSVIIWKVESEALCQFVPWKAFQGHSIGTKAWISESSQLALTMEKTKTVRDCQGNSLTISDQGLAFRYLGRRVKRSRRSGLRFYRTSELVPLRRRRHGRRVGQGRDAEEDPSFESWLRRKTRTADPGKTPRLKRSQVGRPRRVGPQKWGYDQRTEQALVQAYNDKYGYRTGGKENRQEESKGTLDNSQIVTADLLASRLQAVEVRVRESSKFVLGSMLSSVCQNMRATSEILRSTIVLHPTLAVRSILHSYPIMATASNGFVQIFPCVEIPSGNYTLLPVSQDSCSQHVPISFTINGQPQIGYLDPIDNLIHRHPLSVPCETSTHEVPMTLEGRSFIFDLRSGRERQVEPSRVLQLGIMNGTHFEWRGSPNFQALGLYDWKSIMSHASMNELLVGLNRQRQIFRELGVIPEPGHSNPESAGEAASKLAKNIIRKAFLPFLPHTFKEVWILLVCIYVTVGAVVYHCCYGVRRCCKKFWKGKGSGLWASLAWAGRRIWALGGSGTGGSRSERRDGGERPVIELVGLPPRSQAHPPVPPRPKPRPGGPSLRIRHESGVEQESGLNRAEEGRSRAASQLSTVWPLKLSTTVSLGEVQEGQKEQQNGGGKWRSQIRCELNQTPFLVFVDSCAGVNLLDEEALAHLPNVSLIESDIGTLSAINGTKSEIQHCAELEVKVGKIRVKQRFYVAKNLPSLCLLGTPFFQCFNVLSFDMKRNYLQLDDQRVPFECSGTQAPCWVRVPQSLVVPPQTMVCFVAPVEMSPVGTRQCETSEVGQPTVLFGLSGDFEEKTALSCFPEEYSEQGLRIKLVNWFSSPIRLHENQKLGMIYSPPKVECKVSENVCGVEAEAEDRAPGGGTPRLRPGEAQGYPRINQGMSREEFWEGFPTLSTLPAEMGQGERESLKELLYSYRDVFAFCDGDVTQTDCIEMSLPTGDADPVRARPMKLPLEHQEFLKGHVRQLLQWGRVRPSVSPWLSQVFAVPKKSTSGKKAYRAVFNYKPTVNTVLKFDSFPIPSVQSMFDALAGVKVMTSLDLRSGYHAVRIKESDRYKTAFAFENSTLLEWCVAPFGLSLSPIIFARLFQRVLGDLVSSACLFYVDEILVIGKSYEDHRNNLFKVLQRMREFNLKLRPDKSQFCLSSLSLLGFRVTAEGLKPCEEKVKAIRELKPPRSAEEARSLVGFLSFYRCFVFGFSQIIFQIQQLVKSGSNFKWTESHEKEFERIKNVLSREPVLKYPIMDKACKFFVVCDASLKGFGAALEQEQEDGRVHPVAFASRVLTPAEAKLPIYVLEAAGIAWAVCVKFSKFLTGRRFCVVTDNLPVKWLLTTNSTTRKLASIQADLNDFDFEIVHRAGRQLHVDYLSRHPVEEHELGAGNGRRGDECVLVGGCEVERGDEWACAVTTRARATGTGAGPASGATGATPAPTTSRRATRASAPSTSTASSDAGTSRDPTGSTQPGTGVKPTIDLGLWSVEQAEDVYLGPIIRFLTTTILPNQPRYAEKVRRRSIFYVVLDGLCHHKDSLVSRPEQFRISVPVSLIPLVLQQHHDSLYGGLHQGIEKTYLRIATWFHWLTMYADVEAYVNQCPTCNLNKIPGPHPRTEIRTWSIAMTPFSRVSMDILELPLTSSGNRWVLGLVDHCTRYSTGYPMPDRSAVTVAKILTTMYFTQYGVVVEFVTDQEASFRSALMAEICKQFDVKEWTLTPPFFSQRNGLVERFFRSLTSSLRCGVKSNHHEWDMILPFAIFGYNSSFQSSLKETPYFLLYGRDPRLPLTAALRYTPSAYSSWGTDEGKGFVTATVERLALGWRLAAECLARAQDRQMSHANRDLKPPPTLRIGQVVGVFVRSQWRGVKYKLAQKLWPHRIVAIYGDVVELVPLYARTTKIVERHRNHVYQFRLNYTHSSEVWQGDSSDSEGEGRAGKGEAQGESVDGVANRRKAADRKRAIYSIPKPPGKGLPTSQTHGPSSGNRKKKP